MQTFHKATSMAIGRELTPLHLPVFFLLHRHQPLLHLPVIQNDAVSEMEGTTMYVISKINIARNK